MKKKTFTTKQEIIIGIIAVIILNLFVALLNYLLTNVLLNYLSLVYFTTFTYFGASIISIISNILLAIYFAMQKMIYAKRIVFFVILLGFVRLCLIVAGYLYVIFALRGV